VNSNKAKYIITNWLIFEKNYLGAVTEYDGADVIGIKRSLYVSEFELKTSKSDLIRELKIVGVILNQENILYAEKKIYSNLKYYKHKNYLKNYPNLRSYDFNPNEFSFIVIEEFKEIVIDYIKDTKYGAYSIRNTSGYYFIDELKKPQKLHNKKIDSGDFLKLFRKTSTENNFLREKLYFQIKDETK